MSIFSLLKRKPKFEDRPDSSPTITNITPMIEERPDPIQQMIAGIPDSSEKAQRMNTYDILVFEPNPNGSMKQKMVSGVQAASPQALAAMYAADGAKIQILKEYGSSKQEQQAPMQPQQARLTPSPTIQLAPPPQVSPVLKEPPKFFEIGGVKCKLEDGKMFQEQWVRVDSTKYRLIADNSNKLCPMTGKHLETLKWVQIENTESDGETENA